MGCMRAVYRNFIFYKCIYFSLKSQKELREEDRRYREHLHHLMEAEKAKERELEQLIQAEVERMWQKRLDQWKTERQARKKLMQDVLAIRAQQVQERCE